MHNINANSKVYSLKFRDGGGGGGGGGGTTEDVVNDSQFSRGRVQC